MPPTRSVPRLRAAMAAAALGWAAAAPVHAGLFDDEEARKAIIELRARVVQLEDANRVRVTELGTTQSQLVEQIAALRRSLLDLHNQLEAARAELARLRGSDETLARDVAELQRRQRDVGQSLDDRLRRLEPVKAVVDGREVLVDPEEKRSFEEALATLRGGDFDRAVAQFGALQRRWPASAYGPGARYWSGNAHYARRDYREAIASFRAFVAESPQHPRAAEAMLALANSQTEMKDPKAARRTLEDLLKAYPQSEAAQAGRERLATLEPEVAPAPPPPAPAPAPAAAAKPPTPTKPAPRPATRPQR